MLSEFQKKKVAKVFSMYDVDGNGVINKADFERVVENLSKLQGCKEGSSAYEAIKSKYFSVWNELDKAANTNNDGEVSLDEFLKFNEKWISQEGSPNKALGELWNQMFQMLDVDGDEKITVEEYKIILESHNLNPSEAETIFSKLDINGDGYISKEEFVQLCFDYYTSNEPQAPTTSLLGSL